MPVKLHIDVETYSSENLKRCGAHRYTSSFDFEVLLLAYAYDDGPVAVVDLANGEPVPPDFITAFNSPDYELHAHNATFERLSFNALGMHTEPADWHCNMAKAAYCGLPLSLGKLSEALGLDELGKKTTGRALIKKFCVPCKPSKTNGGRLRNMPHHCPEDWDAFKQYIKYDVIAERAAGERMAHIELPATERAMYVVDQDINDRGVKVDLELARGAVAINGPRTRDLLARMKELTQLENPNSPPQLAAWLSEHTGKDITTVAKDSLAELAAELGPGPVSDVIELRSKVSKTSIKKYNSMLESVDDDGRARGLVQYYGANRTGRWAGRRIQVQNLKKNYLPDLDTPRDIVKARDYELALLMYNDVNDIMSQLIRTAFVAPEGKVLAPCDFSAIEARVIAWLAGESWRERIFAPDGHGRIYEESAARMFDIPIESIDKGSPYRAKGKIAELALGFGGSVGALKQMGGESMGLSDTEMKDIVDRWRAKSPKIAHMWKVFEGHAIRAIKYGRRFDLPTYKNVYFDCPGDNTMRVGLPSGRELIYQSPRLGVNKWGRTSVEYKFTHNQQWVYVDTYGGKLTENIVQATARDIMRDALLRLAAAGFDTVLHVHDEAVPEVPKVDYIINFHLARIEKIMSEPTPWAPGLYTPASGYITPYYKKHD